jgi:hypothetical protein
MPTTKNESGDSLRNLMSSEARSFRELAQGVEHWLTGDSEYAAKGLV